MKKVLIIGNLGYIGPVLEKHLKHDYIIYGCDQGYFQNDYSVENKISINNNLHGQYFFDVRKFDSSILNNIDKIVYLAAISNDPMGNKFKKQTFDINQNSAVKIAKESKKRGVKDFVFASSCSVYGTGGANTKNEESDLDPLTNYAKSKINTELELKKIADQNFKVKCLRFATACGFSPRLRLDLVLNDFVASAILYGEIKILSDGSPWRPLINVKDMSRAIDWALKSEIEESFLSINIGSNEWNYTIKDLADNVKKIIPNINVSINKNADPDKRSYRVDFSKFKRIAPNYVPQVSLLETISELKNGIEQMNFRINDFRKSNYIRLNKLNYLIENNFINDNLNINDGQ
jgi:nucleoside-diphosphate-sugar epimerase